jgi:hypothetical protein
MLELRRYILGLALVSLTAPQESSFGKVVSWEPIQANQLSGVL